MKRVVLLMALREKWNEKVKVNGNKKEIQVPSVRDLRSKAAMGDEMFAFLAKDNISSWTRCVCPAPWRRSATLLQRLLVCHKRRNISYLLSIQAAYKYFSVGGTLRVLIRGDRRIKKRKASIKAFSSLDFLLNDSWKYTCVKTRWKYMQSSFFY